MIAHLIADHGGIWQRRAFLFQFRLDDFLGIVPGGSGIGHEDGLIETEDRDRDQVADKEERFDEGKGERTEKDRQEDVEHSLLRVLGADLDYLLAVGDGGLLGILQLDVGLDELDGTVRAGGYGLHGCAGEPVDHGTAGNQAEKEWSME